MEASNNQQPDLFERTTDDNFVAWVHTAAGGEIANQFIRASISMLKAGWRHFGAKAIAENIRWEIKLRYGPSGANRFKLNNNMVSRLARFAEQRVPELRDFFEKRTLRS